MSSTDYLHNAQAWLAQQSQRSIDYQWEIQHHNQMHKALVLQKPRITEHGFRLHQVLLKVQPPNTELTMNGVGLQQMEMFSFMVLTPISLECIVVTP